MPEQNEIESLKREISELKNLLNSKEELLRKKIQKTSISYHGILTTDEVVRYSRQMIIPNINSDGQVLLKNSNVLVVGIGGLGCPATLYLSAAGVGKISLVDYDNVELSNLHRQILHKESNIGMPKVTSAYCTLTSINSNIQINPINDQVNSKTIEKIIKANKFDVVLDCSDNVATRYLLNDVCVLNKLPLVSGSALQMDGQLTVYNYKGGPCYRCLFPEPPPSNTVMNCGDAGVLGAGVIGVLQALEAIKVITGSDETLSGKFLVFDATDTSFRRVKLRDRNSKCKVCGDDPTITTLIDYEQFCGSNISDKVENIAILNPDQHVGIQEFVHTKKDHLVLDVRPELEFKMCNIPGTINFPYSKIERQEDVNYLRHMFDESVLEGVDNVYVLCRRGNDSQRTVVTLKRIFPEMPLNFLNVNGGLYAYSREVDSNFPVY